MDASSSTRSGTSASLHNARGLLVSNQGRGHGREPTHAESSIETIYHHPRVKIVSFSASGSNANLMRRDSIGDCEEEPGSLSWSSRLERTIAVGPLTIYRSAGSVAFLKCGSALQPILRKSRCWCVDELGSQFVLQIRRPQYWRIELPMSSAQEEALSQRFRDILEGILQFEKTHCPFKRSFTIVVPEQVPTVKRPWRPAPRPIIESTPLLNSEPDGPLASFGAAESCPVSPQSPRNIFHGVLDTTPQSFDSVLQFFSQGSRQCSSSSSALEGDIAHCFEHEASLINVGIGKEDFSRSASTGDNSSLAPAAPPFCPSHSQELPDSGMEERPRSPEASSQSHSRPMTPLALPVTSPNASAAEPHALGAPNDDLSLEHDTASSSSWPLLPPSPPISHAGSPSFRPCRIDSHETIQAPNIPREGPRRHVPRSGCPAPPVLVRAMPSGHRLPRPLRSDPAHVGTSAQGTTGFSVKTVLRICIMFFDVPGVIFDLIFKTTCRLFQRDFNSPREGSATEGDQGGVEAMGDASIPSAAPQTEVGSERPGRALGASSAFTSLACLVRDLPTFEEERTWGLD